jgi:hypothetical protein
MPRRVIKDAKGLGEWLIRYWIAERAWERDNPGQDPRMQGGPQPDLSRIAQHVELNREDQLLFALDRKNLLHIVVPMCPEGWSLDHLEKMLKDDSTPIDPEGGPKRLAGDYKKELGFVLCGGCR